MSPNMLYQVKIDDNYRYMDESARLDGGTFSSLDVAIKKCKKIVENNLREICESGMTAEDLSVRWSMFGEDPFIVGAAEGIPFSARDYVTVELCKAVISQESHG